MEFSVGRDLHIAAPLVIAIYAILWSNFVGNFSHCKLDPKILLLPNILSCGPFTPFSVLRRTDGMFLFAVSNCSQTQKRFVYSQPICWIFDDPAKLRRTHPTRIIFTTYFLKSNYRYIRLKLLAFCHHHHRFIIQFLPNLYKIIRRIGLQNLSEPLKLPIFQAICVASFSPLFQFTCHFPHIAIHRISQFCNGSQFLSCFYYIFFSPIIANEIR